METAHWLLKSEPEKYSFADLIRDGSTVWDGVRNNQAALYLKAMKVGERALIYHSQSDKAAVGVARITREAFIDPSDPAGRFVAELPTVEAPATPAVAAAIAMARAAVVVVR